MPKMALQAWITHCGTVKNFSPEKKEKTKFLKLTFWCFTAFSFWGT